MKLIQVDAAEQHGTDGNANSAVAVIITTYNQEAFLAEAIESVLSQSHKAAEIIVVDDESTVPAEDIVTQFPGVEYLRKPNGGASSARNAGLARTTSPFVLFLDADDRLLREALAAGVADLRQRPDVGQTSGRAYLITSDGKRLGAFKAPPSSRRPLYEEMLRRPYACPPSVVMFRRSVLEDIGGWSTDSAYMEDWDLYLRAGRAAEMGFHSKFIAEYRMHRGQTSTDARAMRHAIVELLTREAVQSASDPAVERARRSGLRYWRIRTSHDIARQQRNESRLTASLSGRWRAELRVAFWLLPASLLQAPDRLSGWRERLRRFVSIR
jgi:glycosyltransferase involved in cell wall biosynthesis